MFLKISQNSQKNTVVGVSFNKVASLRILRNFQEPLFLEQHATASERTNKTTNQVIHTLNQIEYILCQQNHLPV